MLGRLAALRMLRLLRVWVACAALSLLPAPGAALALTRDPVTVQAADETQRDRPPSEDASVVTQLATRPVHVARRTVARRPVRGVASAPRRALYLRHCSLLL